MASLLTSSARLWPSTTPKPYLGIYSMHNGRSLSVSAFLTPQNDTSALDSKSFLLQRRALVGFALSSVLLEYDPSNALAVKQALLAGRIPGLSAPDENGIRTYHRPEEKSGGHGVGWSPMIPYSFKVPEEWEEVPVSIADLGGTEIDLRFSSSQEGNLSIVVAPVLRFSDAIGDNARIEDIGSPEVVIDAFGPEVTGDNVEGKVKAMEVKKYEGRTYYQYELDPHVLVAATAAGNRLYLMTVRANGGALSRATLQTGKYTVACEHDQGKIKCIEGILGRIDGILHPLLAPTAINAREEVTLQLEGAGGASGIGGEGSSHQAMPEMSSAASEKDPLKLDPTFDKTKINPSIVDKMDDHACCSILND